MVAKIYLTLAQASYTIKEYQEDDSNTLRRNTMNSLQSSLPVAVRRAAAATPVTYRGYQYEFGLEELAVLDVAPALPGVFVQGPYVIPGCPEVVRFDAVTSGTVACYLCYRAYDATGTLLDENLQGVPVTPGSAFVFPFAGTADRDSIASTEVDLRFVLRSADASVTRYSLQATLR